MRKNIFTTLKWIAIIMAIVTFVSLVMGKAIVMIVAGAICFGAFCFYMDFKEESDEDR